jgi:hypothetical protein
VQVKPRHFPQALNGVGWFQELICVSAPMSVLVESRH